VTGRPGGNSQIGRIAQVLPLAKVGLSNLKLVFVLLIGFPSKGTPNTPAGANSTIQQSVCADEKKEEKGNIHYSLVILNSAIALP
jgi:hypothetical protein